MSAPADFRDPNEDSGTVQVILLPRCRRRDGGCGSHRVHCVGTKLLDPVTRKRVRHYTCLTCGRRFKAFVMTNGD